MELHILIRKVGGEKTSGAYGAQDKMDKCTSAIGCEGFNMTKFAQFIAQPAQDKAADDAAAIKIIQDFLDGIDQRREAAIDNDTKFIWVTDDKNPQIIIEICNNELELKTAFRRWRLRPFDLVDTLEKNGYPMRDIRFIEEINEVRIWLKK